MSEQAGTRAFMSPDIYHDGNALTAERGQGEPARYIPHWRSLTELSTNLSHKPDELLYVELRAILSPTFHRSWISQAGLRRGARLLCSRRDGLHAVDG